MQDSTPSTEEAEQYATLCQTAESELARCEHHVAALEAFLALVDEASGASRLVPA